MVLLDSVVSSNNVLMVDPSVDADSDDTAKTITALNLLGYSASYDSLIERFEVDSHFQCFQHERNPSFSANCNVLLAFLHAPDPSEYLSQILKCVRYICYEWWNTDGPLKDKWNLSVYYPSLLASQGLIRLLHLYETSLLEVPEKLLQVKVMVVLFQILSRILQQQNEDGSWGPLGSREETAYAIITLANVDSLPFVTPVAGQIEAAISRGRKYLKTLNALDEIKLTPKDYIWSGKISYGVENVCHSYVLAALNTPVPQFLLGPRVSALVNIPAKRLSSFAKFYGKLPMFQGVDTWKIKAWLIEGYLFLPDLEKARLGVFDRNGMDEEKYFEYLPFSWTGPNGLENINAGAQTLFDMMMVSMINYQVDEFFDVVVARGDLFTIAQLRRSIEKLFAGIRVSLSRDVVNGVESLPDYDQEIYHQLEDFLNFVVTYPRIQNASDNDKALLQLELKAYLLAHTQQCEDSIKLRRQKLQSTYSTPPSSYMRWVRNTASDHLSAQYAYAFMVCLLGEESDYLPTSEMRFIAQDVCTHLSVICRMFNDYGSLDRDRKESNLNSLFFPEFDGNSKSDQQLRGELVRLTKYERKCLSLSFDELKMACGERHKRVYDMMRLFYNASEIYTEVYEVRDLSTWH